jgi:hypothetical protein
MNGAFEPRALLQNFLGALLIGPEIGLCCLCFQSFEFRALGV